MAFYSVALVVSPRRCIGILPCLVQAIGAPIIKGAAGPDRAVSRGIRTEDGAFYDLGRMGQQTTQC